jgi:hypothetical protein
MTDTAQFNIGGKPYKVSRSLLESHPNTMLANIASEKWQEDPEAEIFIERNGNRFQYVLDYMRDGKVVLPVTESKESVLAELKYFGVEANKSEVSDTSAKRADCVKSYSTVIQDLKDKIEKDHMDYRCARYALDIITTYTDKVVNVHGYTTEVQSLCFNQNNKKENRRELLKIGSQEVLGKVDNHLSPLGLKLRSIGKYNEDANVELVGTARANKKRRLRVMPSDDIKRLSPFS